MLGLRQYAFRLFQEEGNDNTDIDNRDKSCTASSDHGVRLPCPLWEAMHSTSGFAFLAILAPVTIMSWAVAVPLTLITVPWLISVRPCSLRLRPLRSLALLCFLGGNFFLLAVPPATRAELVGGAVSGFGRKCHSFYLESIVPSVPREGRKFLPSSLFDWLEQGSLSEALGQDLLVGLFEIARDF